MRGRDQKPARKARRPEPLNAETRVGSGGVTRTETRAQAGGPVPDPRQPTSPHPQPCSHPPGETEAAGWCAEPGPGLQSVPWPRAPTFWVRASSSAWISNSPSSESLLRAWEAAPRRFRSPFFFLHWAMAVRDRGPAAGSLPAAMRALVQGTGEGAGPAGTYQRCGRAGGHGVSAGSPPTPPSASPVDPGGLARMPGDIPDWPEWALSEASGKRRGRPERGDLPPGADGSGRAAPSLAGCRGLRARSTRL